MVKQVAHGDAGVVALREDYVAIGEMTRAVAVINGGRRRARTSPAGQQQVEIAVAVEIRQHRRGIYPISEAAGGEYLRTGDKTLALLIEIASGGESAVGLLQCDKKIRIAVVVHIPYSDG